MYLFVAFGNHGECGFGQFIRAVLVNSHKVEKSEQWKFVNQSFFLKFAHFQVFCNSNERIYFLIPFPVATKEYPRLGNL